LRFLWVDKQKAFSVTLAGGMLTAVTWLASIGNLDLQVYLSVFAVCYFAASALFRPRRRYFDVVGAGLFLVFCYIVALKVLGILLK
jgi:hypothetical protein